MANFRNPYTEYRVVPGIDHFRTGGRARLEGEVLQTQNGLAGNGMAPGCRHRLYFGELVLSQRIIDSPVIAMLGYAIEVRKEAKLSSDAAPSADGPGQHLDRKCRFDWRCCGRPPPH